MNDLKTAIKECGLTMDKLAANANLDPSVIRAFKNGHRNLAQDSRLKLEMALNLPLSLSNLAVMRVKLGKSMRIVEEEMGISMATLSRYENDVNTIPVWQLKRLCRYYNCDSFDILGF